MSQNTTDKQAYLNATPMQREVVRRLLCDVLGCLRAQYLSYQTSHWQVVGQSFYGNHLLFNRLYESVMLQTDSLAEKLVGYLGREVVDLNHQMRHITGYTMAWSQIDCHHKRGIRSEQDLQAALRRAYDGIKQAQAMTLGLDDWIMATANAHEENEYLLQQALTPVPGQKQAGTYDRYPSIRVPRGWRPSADQSEGCTEGYMDEVSKDFTKTSETFIKRAILPALKKRGWGAESHGVTEPLYSEDGAAVEVEVWGRAGQKIGLGGRKYIVLDRDVSRVIEIMMIPELSDETFEGSEQFDVDEFAEWSWEAECPTDEISALGYSGSEFASTPKGVEELLGAFDRDWIRSSRVRSKIKKKSSTDEDYFYKAPDQRAVLEFARSNAISNDVAVAEDAAKEDHLDIPESQAIAEAEEAPPLPTEIAKEPGGAAVSTLNQYVIKSEDPVAEEAVPMNESRMAAWLKELT